MERLENVRRLFRRKAGAAVADLDQRDVVGADRREADRRRAAVLRAAVAQHLGGVAAEVLDHPLHVVGIGEKLEFRRNVDGVSDRARRCSASAVSTIWRTSSRRSKRRRRRRLFAPAAVGERRLAEQDGAVERRHQPRRETLGERIGDGRQAVGNELRGREHVAQVVVDARDRHAELGQPLALAAARGRASPASPRAPSRRGRSRRCGRSAR